MITSKPDLKALKPEPISYKDIDSHPFASLYRERIFTPTVPNYLVYHPRANSEVSGSFQVAEMITQIFKLYSNTRAFYYCDYSMEINYSYLREEGLGYGSASEVHSTDWSKDAFFIRLETIQKKEIPIPPLRELKGLLIYKIEDYLCFSGSFLWDGPFNPRFTFFLPYEVGIKGSEVMSDLFNKTETLTERVEEAEVESNEIKDEYYN